MQHFETIADVNQNGIVTITLPANIQPGKHRMILVIDEDISENKLNNVDHSQLLMQLAGQVNAFNSINDPVLWQQQQRNEWKREWDKL